MEAMDPAAAAILVGDESLLLSCRRGKRERLFRSVTDDIERAAAHYRGDLIDEGTLLGVLRDRVGALEHLAQVEFPSEGS